MGEDVTKSVSFGFGDDGFVPITKCCCGKEFGNWDEVWDLHDDAFWECPECGVTLEYTRKVIIERVDK